MQNLSYKTLFIILLLLLIPIVFLSKINQKGKQVLADWFDQAWSYRQAINISTHASLENNVYIVATVNIGTTAKAQADGGDFRFTDSTGTLLDYYISSGVGTTNVTFHINFATFPSGAQTIYAYYGNPSATNGFNASDFSTLASSYSIGSYSTEETGGGPIVWWKFDEGVGTSIANASQNRNNGLAYGTTWQTEDQCISGKCLYFNGTDNRVDGNTKLEDATSELTVETWVYPVNPPNVVGRLIASTYDWDVTPSLQRGWSLGNNYGSADAIYMQLFDSSGNNSIAQLNNFFANYKNKWVHVVGTYKSGAYVRIYINGKLAVESTTSIISAIAPGAYNLRIGTRADTTGQAMWDGKMDDVKIFPYARSSSQIKQDYASGLAGQSSNQGGNVNFGSSSQKSLSDGLIAYYKFNEGVGTSSSDSSGSSNTTTFATGDSAPTWGSGKFGVGLSFDGNDYSQLTISGGSLPSITTGQVSISAWVYPSSTSPDMRLVDKTDNGYGYGLALINGVPNFRTGDSSTYTNLSAGITIPNNTWTNIIATYQNNRKIIYINGIQMATSTTTVNPQNVTGYLKFGTRSTEFFTGSLDEIRIYNRALTAAEVRQLTDYAPGPVGHWNFEEGVGTTAYDRSGNNSNALLVGSPQWTAGKIGNALLFDGSNTWLDAGTQPSLNITNAITIESWVYLKASDGQWDSLISKGKTNGYYIMQRSGNTSLTFGTTLSVSGYKEVSINASDISINKWYYLTATYDGSNMKIYLDGALKTTSAASGTIGTNNSSLIIGASTNASERWPGLLDDVKVYNYARTQQQILQDMNGGGSPVAGGRGAAVYYKFNEGFGTATNNSGIGGTINGTFGTGASTPTWSNLGKNGGALSFDGVDDYVTVPYPSLLTYSGLTISTWIKTNNAAQSQTILSQNGPFALQIGSSKILGKIYTGSWTTATGTTTLQNNTWYHVTLIYDGSNISIYINGKLDVQTPKTGTFLGSNTMYIGYPQAVGYQLPFNGLIDEVKFYNYALSGDEIKSDYNQGASVVASTSNQTIGGTTTSLDYCVPSDTASCLPPIAEYKFEEGVGTSIFDTSGNNNHGRWLGTLGNQWTPGKIGNAGLFNGTNNTISIGSSIFSIANALTLEAWVYPTATSVGNIIADVSTWDYRIYNVGTTLYMQVSLDDGNSGYHAVNNALTLNSWQHIAGVFDGNTVKLYVNGRLILSEAAVGSIQTPGAGINIGSNGGGTEHYTGKTDQVRIYNYARTPAQVAYDYNKGGPVGWWKFDECQGIVAHDSSELGNSASISIGASGTQSSLGTCKVGTGTSSAWTNGAAGQLNGSLNFDGNDDYVSTVDAPSLDMGKMTVSAWIKTTNSSEQCIVERNNTTFYFCTSGGKLRYYINSVGASWTTSTKSVNDNSWHQVVATWDGSNKSLYIDGLLDTVAAGTGGDISNAAVGLNIGVRMNSGVPQFYFQGLLDDVRLYNYPLTSTQIKSIYNNGSINFR